MSPRGRARSRGSSSTSRTWRASSRGRGSSPWTPAAPRPSAPSMRARRHWTAGSRTACSCARSAQRRSDGHPSRRRDAARLLEGPPRRPPDERQDPRSARRGMTPSLSLAVPRPGPKLAKADVLHLIKSLGRGGAETLLTEGYKAGRSVTGEARICVLPCAARRGRPAARVAGGSRPHLRRGERARHDARHQENGTVSQRTPHRHRSQPTCRWRASWGASPGASPASPSCTQSTARPAHTIRSRQAASWATWGSSSGRLPYRRMSQTQIAPARAATGRHPDHPEWHRHRPLPARPVRPAPRCEPRSASRLRLGSSGSWAQFVPQKQLDVWLDTARIIHEADAKARFIIVGDGLLSKDIRAHATHLGLDGVVQFAGIQSDVRPYVEAMDVFMMASKSEGAPLAPVEAMALEVPVVAFAAPGVRNTITSGRERRTRFPRRGRGSCTRDCYCFFRIRTRAGAWDRPGDGPPWACTACHRCSEPWRRCMPKL